MMMMHQRNSSTPEDDNPNNRSLGAFSTGRSSSTVSFKVVMVGDQSVGKTHILHQFVKG